jgi:hypothetical protein
MVPMRNLTLPLFIRIFIRKNLGPITEEWKDFAANVAAKGTDDLILRNHVHYLLFYIADDIESPQTKRQQASKSLGKMDKLKESPGAEHGIARFDHGFDLVAMISEYRALRATIIKLWTASRLVLTDADIRDLIRFNEAIDQLLAQSVASFAKEPALTREIA